MVSVVILVAIVILCSNFRSEARGPDERVPHRRPGQPRPGQITIVATITTHTFTLTSMTQSCGNFRRQECWSDSYYYTAN